MAYLRAREDCGVYFYWSVNDVWECCGCSLLPKDKTQITVAFSDISDAILHLRIHAANKDVTFEEAEKVIAQMHGIEPREPDLVIQDLVSTARAGGGKIASDDSDVPADIRITADELLAQLAEQALQEGNYELVSAVDQVGAQLHDVLRYPTEDIQTEYKRLMGGEFNGYR